MLETLSAADVSAVVCTMNSISGIEECLKSLKVVGIEEIVVVDANSTDGTREVADRLANIVLTDPGTGLGNARNIGIARSTKPLILNMGSDNVMPAGQLDIMIETLIEQNHHGVSAQTIIQGDNYVSRGLNAWRAGRFPPGPTNVIGTPTLFRGDLLRSNPYDPTRVFSDDSELCERWIRDFNASFAISRAYVYEIGKTTWKEVKVRCRMYGQSDREVFRQGKSDGWSTRRQLESLTYPARVDFARPLSRLGFPAALRGMPFLTTFTSLRYVSWARAALKDGKR
jgi:glycosyltransferase involved in cell wall biosynthesis